ncbi:MAG TPA: sulfurtransferase TusA family protein [Arenibaculum sp.]|nr:sulfurtransferase TusA family protein [Arenibaculum sp.]
MTRHSLDAKGLTCPLPVLRARKMLKSLAAGDVLEIEATDPAAERDFPAFCEASGNALKSAVRRDGIYVFEIEKAG